MAEKLAIELGVNHHVIASEKNKNKEDSHLLAYHLLLRWHENVTFDNTKCCKLLAAALSKHGKAVLAKKVDPQCEGNVPCSHCTM